MAGEPAMNDGFGEWMSWQEVAKGDDEAARRRGSRERSSPDGRPVSADETHDRAWERDLVSRICAGDSVAFVSLYECFHEKVYRYIVRRVRDRAEAEDLAQETFTQAYRSMSRFEGRSSLLTWLIGIARFTCLRFHRFSSRWMIGPQARQENRDHPVEEGIESQLDAMRMLEWCGRLVARECGEMNQTIFQLRYGSLKSTRFIASAVGKSEDAVKASLRRSRLVIARGAGALEGSRSVSGNLVPATS